RESLVEGDVVGGGEVGKEGLVEAMRGFGVEIFNNGVLSQIRILETRYEPFALALDRLAIDQQAETFFERELLDIAPSTLLLERLGHAGEPKGDQPVGGRMGEHIGSSLTARLGWWIVPANAGGISAGDMITIDQW